MSIDKECTSDVYTKKRASFYEKLSYGIGGICETLSSNVIFNLAMPIYSIALGVDARLVGLAVSLPRLWDAFTDPLIGNISDNTRLSWGRRKPFILLGAILTGLFCMAMWAPPANLGHTGLFYYFLIISILYFTSYSIFQVPYSALGFELSEDYNERTSVMSYKTFIMGIGGVFLLSMAYKLCFKFGHNEVEGARVVGVIFGLAIIITGIVPAIFNKESCKAMNQEKIVFWKALMQTSQNKAFLILCGVMFFILVGFFIANPLLIYINIAYICDGNKEMAATLFGYNIAIYGILGFAIVPLIKYLADKWDKKAVLLIGVFLVMIGFGLSWFYFNRKYPYLQLIFGVLASPGMSCLWVLTASCVADICDLDEYKTGLRREGMYGAMFMWLQKLGIAAILAISGYIVQWSGFDQAVSVQSESVILKLRLMFAGAPLLFLAFAFILVIFYPVNRKTIENVQALLLERKRHI
jgi:GPH family glycoside/pentoside/hexuronide:cation symporter